MLAQILAVYLMGCGNTEEKNAQEAQGCPNDATITISGTYPDLNDAGHFYIRDSVAFYLTANDPSAYVVITDSNGDAVAGTSVVDGTTVLFTADHPLFPSSSYTAGLYYCGAEDVVNIQFSTSELGAALQNDVAGKGYAMHLGTAHFVYPEGLDALFNSLFQNYMLLGVTGASDSLDFLVGLSQDGSFAQDFCYETLDNFPSADFSKAPYFVIEEGDVVLSAVGYSAKIYNLSMTGTFAPDASYFGGGTFQAELDARELVDVINATGFPVDSADDICDLVGSLQLSCAPCSHDGANYCVEIYVDQITAESTNVPVYPVCAVDCHESCSTNLPECTEPQNTLDVCE